MRTTKASLIVSFVCLVATLGAVAMAQPAASTPPGHGPGLISDLSLAPDGGDPDDPLAVTECSMIESPLELALAS